MSEYGQGGYQPGGRSTADFSAGAYEPGAPRFGPAGEPDSAAQQTKERAQQQARQLADRAKQRAREQVDQRSTQAGDQVSTAAADIRTVREVLGQLGRENPAKIADEAARRTERAGNYLKESDADRLLGDLEDFGRRQPWAVVAGGLALGFAASRFLKASSSRRYRSGAGELRPRPIEASVPGAGARAEAGAFSAGSTEPLPGEPLPGAAAPLGTPPPPPPLSSDPAAPRWRPLPPE